MMWKVTCKVVVIGDDMACRWSYPKIFNNVYRNIIIDVETLYLTSLEMMWSTSAQECHLLIEDICLALYSFECNTNGIMVHGAISSRKMSQENI